MKTEIKQTGDVLAITGAAMDEKEKQLLKEFFQKEIPGYDHSLNYFYDEQTGSFQFRFLPVISKRNLEKEYGERMGSSVQEVGEFWEISDGLVPIKLRIHSNSHSYQVIAGNGTIVIEEGHVDHMYHFRKILKRMNGYAGNPNYL